MIKMLVGFVLFFAAFATLNVMGAKNTEILELKKDLALTRGMYVEASERVMILEMTVDVHNKILDNLVDRVIKLEKTGRQIGD